MCTAEIVHYRVDRVVKKTRQGLKEQAQSVLHHDRTINHMLGQLQTLEEERSEIDQYQKLSDVVQAWDTRIDSLERSRSQGVRDANMVALHYRTKVEDLKAQMMVTELGNQLEIQQLKEWCRALENTSIEAVHRIGSLETQVGVSSLLLFCWITDDSFRFSNSRLVLGIYASATVHLGLFRVKGLQILWSFILPNRSPQPHPFLCSMRIPFLVLGH